MSYDSTLLDRDGKKREQAVVEFVKIPHFTLIFYEDHERLTKKVMIFIEIIKMAINSKVIMKTNTRQTMNHQRNVQTLTESGTLYQALQIREARNNKLQRRRERMADLKALFFGDTLEELKKIIGKTLAKITYTLWKRGFFAAYDEFSSPRST